MTAAPRAWPEFEPRGKVSREPGWWGMILLIATEAALFGYLLFSYFYVASNARGTWPPGGPPELRLALPNTFVLLASSGTVWAAERGIKHGSKGWLAGGLAATLMLGVVFLSIQAMEYANARFSPRTHAYGSLFFGVTGFHGTHVLAGLVMIAFVLARALRGHFGPDRHLAVTNVALYWHFVDAVWLAVFTSLYLVPRFV